MKIAIVTASLNPEAQAPFIDSWGKVFPLHIETGTFGVVPAFYAGIQRAMSKWQPDVIACLHDDLSILDPQWDTYLTLWFQYNKGCLLAGFGGALGLGEDGIYHHPYSPYDLVRKDFISNMRDAEAHGRRVSHPTRVACLDGFSQIGRSDFMLRAFAKMMQLGVTHHLYDGMLGAFAKREKGQVWMIPIPCHHAGGMTAVGNTAYQEWANREIEGGDRGFWEKSHRIGYEEFRDVLPIRVY